MAINLQSMTNRAMQLTEEVTTRWSSRITGSKACLDCGEYLQEQIATFCEKTESQEFDVRPGAFLGYLKIVVVLYFLALIALWMQQLEVAAILSTCSIILTILEFYIYWEFVDFLYPLKKGRNIWGTIEPTGEVKQQIIISAHHDSAHIFNFLTDNPKTYVRNVLIGSLSTYALAIVSWILVVINYLDFDIGLVAYISAGIFTILGYWAGKFWFFYRKEGTPGAGDNMICTAIAMEVGRHFAEQKKAGNGLQHTRVVVASWDSEEAGLRGARAYTKAHQSSLQSLKTYNFNLECMYDHKELALLTSDLNNFVQLSESMVNEALDIGKRLGINVKKVPFPMIGGGTDAAEFAKIGVEATTLAAMNWTTLGDKPAYHTPRDTIEAVDAKAVEKSIELGIHYVLEKDRQVAV